MKQAISENETLSMYDVNLTYDVNYDVEKDIIYRRSIKILISVITTMLTF